MEKTRKIVIGYTILGFGLPKFARETLGIEHWDDIARDDPRLVKLVEQYKGSTYDPFDYLKVVEIPADVEWYVDDNNGEGLESVHEVHRVWY